VGWGAVHPPHLRARWRRARRRRARSRPRACVVPCGFTAAAARLRPKKEPPNKTMAAPAAGARGSSHGRIPSTGDYASTNKATNPRGARAWECRSRRVAPRRGEYYVHVLLLERAQEPAGRRDRCPPRGRLGSADLAPPTTDRNHRMGKGSAAAAVQVGGWRARWARGRVGQGSNAAHPRARELAALHSTGTRTLVLGSSSGYSARCCIIRAKPPLKNSKSGHHYSLNQAEKERGRERQKSDEN
jgi:hypothetical protein